MTDTLLDQLNQRRAALKQERDSSWLAHWQDMNRYGLPRVGRFIATDRNRGDRRNQKILNETVTFAVNTSVRGLMYGITNPSRPWFSLETPFPELNKKQNVRVYLDTLRDRMLDTFRKSNLYTVLPSIYRDLLVYGTNATALNKDKKSIIRLESMPLGSYSLAISGSQRVDTCYREYQSTFRQLMGRFGPENCTQDIQQSYKDGTKIETWTDVCHAVEPNPLHNPDSPFAKHRQFRSIYWQPKGEPGRYLSSSGSNTFPILAPRWDIQDGDTYGQSPLMDVLGTAKGLQRLESKSLTLLDKVIDPALNVPVGLKGMPITQLPGGINWVSGTEQATITPTHTIGNAPLVAVEDKIARYEARINKALFVDIFLLLAGDHRSDITAEEIRARIEEKVQTLGPIMLRLNDELLDQLVDRTFEIMQDPDFEGLIPEAPEELQGVPLTIEYVSEMAKAMKLAGVGSIERTVMFVGNLAAQQVAAGLQPTAWDKLDLDEAIDVYSDLTGSPAKIVRDAEGVAEIRDERNAKQAKAEKASQMQAAADTAQKLGSTPADPESLLAKMGQQGTEA